MRLGLSLTCLSLLASGCFDPDGDELPTATEGSSSSGEATTAASTTSEPDTATEPTTTPPADTTVGTTDDPPTVELLVDGSGAPPDLEHARRVALSAQASDDGTVTRVEFYDGDTLLSSDDAAPFEAEVLLTSLDAGAHAFTALAVDDADQEGTSDPVTLTVSIMGGATVASETNLFQMGGILFHPGIGAVIGNDDEVIVAGSLSTTNFDVTGLGMISLSPDLSATNWQVSVPMSLVEGQPQYLTMGQPHLSPDGGAVLIGGNSMGIDGELSNNTAVLRVAADGSGPLPFLEIESDPEVQNVPLPGLATDAEGNIFLAGPDDDITKLMPMGGGTLWESPVGTAWTTSLLGGHRMRTDDEGDLVFNAFTCNAETDTCSLETRKINGFSGNLQWNQAIEQTGTQYRLHVGGSAPGPDGRVLTLHGPPLEDGGGLHMVLVDGDGGVQQDAMLGGEGDVFAVADLAYDEQGQVTAVGTIFPGGDESMRSPFAARFGDDGTLLWQRTFSFGMVDDQAMALALDRHGRVVVVGIADIEAFFIVFLGDVWVAQLDL